MRSKYDDKTKAWMEKKAISCVDCDTEFICNCIVCNKPVCATHLVDHEFECNGQKTPQLRRKTI